MRQTRPKDAPGVRIEAETGWAWHGADRLDLTPKAFAVLRYLTEHPQHLITKDELLAAAWGDTVVSDAALTSCIRDLLFHVQEYQHDLPEIAAFIAAERLAFLGFDLDARIPQAYRARNPGDPAMTDLDRWHRFECDNPDIFAGMYQFWVQAPA